MKKNLQITIEQAKDLLSSTPSLKDVIYETFPELKPKPKVLDKWEDLKEISGYWTNSLSEIFPTTESVTATLENKSTFATREQAESALAYAQLTQLMKATGDCEGIDWDDVDQDKYIIRRQYNTFETACNNLFYEPIAFLTKSVRDEFFDKHKELLKTYFQIK